MFAFGETALRERPQILDGEAVWSDPAYPPAALIMTGVGFDPSGSDWRQAPDTPSRVESSPKLYDPTYYDVAAGDHITVRGKTYVVDGDPLEWRSPFTGWAPGQVISLKRWEG